MFVSSRCREVAFRSPFEKSQPKGLHELWCKRSLHCLHVNIITAQNMLYTQLEKLNVSLEMEVVLL